MAKVEAKSIALGECGSDDFADIIDNHIRFSAVQKYVTLPEIADLHFNFNTLFCRILEVVGTIKLYWSSKIGVSKISDVELRTQIFIGDSK